MPSSSEVLNSSPSDDAVAIKPSVRYQQRLQQILAERNYTSGGIVDLWWFVLCLACCSSEL
ncbi:MAG UNVERIFIED_CONTAM: hypothetical protein LVR18_15965 [Planctomycetaceae bacterium]